MTEDSLYFGVIFTKKDFLVQILSSSFWILGFCGEFSQKKIFGQDKLECPPKKEIDNTL